MQNRQVEQARRFRDLHHADPILVLLNPWDVGSARIFEAAGSPALGTTSMGVSAVHGLPDEQHITLEQMLHATRQIVEAVEIPVSADLEAGYGSNTEEIVASVEAALDCGIVGINLEDGTADPENPLFDVETMQERIAAIRAAAKKRGLPLVINARTDVFLTQAFAEEQRLPQAIERGNRFRESGADCVFVPGGLTQEAISELVAEIDAPLNVVANPAISIPVVPDVKELQDLGVARVSVGSGVLRATLAYVQRIAAEVLHTGIYQTMQQELEAANAPLAYQRAIGRSPGRQWTLWRQDDHGNRFAVESFSIRSLAQARLREFESRSHHQVYWLESSASEQP